MEEWRDIVDFPNYQVSNLGNVKSLPRQKTKGGILKCGLTRGYKYVILTNPDRHRFQVHRLVLQAFCPNDDNLQVDHINHDVGDNRLENLRWATISQNVRFQKKKENCSSKYKGVYWAKNKNKWRVMCRFEGKKVQIGMFHNEEEAGRAYDNFILEHDLQDFTFLNFI